MSLFFIIALATLVGGVAGIVLLGVGGYALYEGFAKNEPPSLFTSTSTARIVGIIAALLGLLVLCLPIVLIIFGVFGISMSM